MEFGIGAFNRAGARHHYQIQAMQFGPAMTKTVTNDALEAVAVHCPADLLARYGKAQPGLFAVIGTRQNGEIGILGAARPLEDSPKLGGLQQSGSSRKSLAQVSQARNLLGGQAGAAFGATGLDDLTAVGGGHTSTETVVTGALQAARLKCAFHDAVPKSDGGGCPWLANKTMTQPKRPGTIIDRLATVNDLAGMQPILAISRID